MYNVKDKMIELLLSKRQNTKYESDCQDVNSFLSRYFDFNFMWKFIVTNVIERKKLQRFRYVSLKNQNSIFEKFIKNTRKEIKK